MSIIFDSELIQSLERFAQQQNQINSNAALQLAQSLANKLMMQQTGPQQSPDADVYVRNLTSMLALIDFLYANQQRGPQGQLIVIKTSPENPSFKDQMSRGYVEYKDTLFYVDLNGLVWYLGNLDRFAYGNNSANARTMRPLIKHLIAEINQDFKSNLGDNKVVSLGDQNSAGSNNGSSGSGGANSGNGNQQGDYKNVSYQDQQNDGSGSSSNPSGINTQQIVDKVANALPFENPNVISPRDMDVFANNLLDILQKNPVLLKDQMLDQVLNAAVSVRGGYNNWIARVNQIGNEFQTAHAGEYEVNFNVNRPDTSLMNIFGNMLNAKEMAQHLISMLQYTLSALSAIQRSPQLISIIGDTRLKYQINQANNFIRSLGSVVQ